MGEVSPSVPPRHRCPCCGYFTLPERGGYDICKVCFWEDEWAQQQYGEPQGDLPFGANSVPIEEARANFLVFGACEERWKLNVRPPLPEELPENQPSDAPPL